jgi:hypothetical protein
MSEFPNSWLMIGGKRHSNAILFDKMLRRIIVPPNDNLIMITIKHLVCLSAWLGAGLAGSQAQPATPGGWDKTDQAKPKQRHQARRAKRTWARRKDPRRPGRKT